MMDTVKIPAWLLKDIILGLGHEEGQPLAPYLRKAENLSPRVALDHCLKQRGIIGHTDYIFEAVERLNAAEYNESKPQ